MLNQGDFFYTFDGLLTRQPIDSKPYQPYVTPAFVWEYTKTIEKPFKERNLTWIYFWLNTRLQRVFSIDFNLFLMALISKVTMLWCAYRLSASFLTHTSGPEICRPLWFLLLVLAAFYAHNIAFLNSFYGEHVFFLFLPVLLVGLLERRQPHRFIFISLALLFCGGSKPQYFYIPLLAAGVIAGLSLLNKQKIDWRLMGALTVVFGITLFFFINSPTRSLNYYNSTYFGSYLLLTPPQLKQMGVPDAMMACVGTDPWRIKIDPKDTLKLSQGPADCAERAQVTLGAVLAPYLRDPGLLLKMWDWLSPVHFTVKYFHVFFGQKYLLPSDGKSFYNGHTLVRASDLRERVVTPRYAIVIAIGLLLPFVGYRSAVSVETKTATLILALFIPSQLAVAVLGEGIRDLSKHMAAAQFCLDFCVSLSSSSLPPMPGKRLLRATSPTPRQTSTEPLWKRRTQSQTWVYELPAFPK